MKTIKTYFGELPMTWPKVIALAIITAVYTALINQVPFLKDTSFQDIAIYLEWWILFAVFIIVNCEKWWEAALKCFVFFLISQPLIYLIEVPFVAEGWGIFRHYDYWFKVTLLTLPGAVIAFQLKKKNWLSVIVLSVATCFLIYVGVDYFRATLANFPNHLLSAIFAISLAVFFVFVLLDKKIHRIAALIIITAALSASIIFTEPNKTEEFFLEDGNWTYTMEDDSIVRVDIVDGNHVTLTATNEGSTFIHFENLDGTKISYSVTVSGGGIWVDIFD